MKRVWSVIIVTALLLCGCGEQSSTISKNAKEAIYMQITAKQAKEMIDKQEQDLIVDVREQAEYDKAHIPGAVLLLVGTITEETAAEVIPNKESVVLVYCRSGNRSKTAAQSLTDLGYTQIYEFGGILDWPYEVEK